MKKFVSFVLAISMLLGVMMPIMFALEELVNAFDYLIDKEATPLFGDFTDVTLTVPGTSADMSSDVVFIIGNGPNNNYDYIVELVHKMLNATAGSPTKIKVGMVGFKDTTEEETVLGLTEMKDTVVGNNVADYRIEGRYNNGKEYTESLEDYKARKAAAFASWEAEEPKLLEDMEYIFAKALEKAEDLNDTINMESALITARDMLIADEEVPANRKHMILVSTGLTYWFDNDAGEPVTVVGTNQFGNIMHGNKYWLKARDNSTNTSSGYYMKGWMLVNDENGNPDYQASWNRYWEMIKGWIAADQNKYVYNPEKTYSEFYYNGNSTEIRPQNNANYRYGSAILNPDDLAKVTGAVPYFAGGADPATNPNAAHALNYERAQYESWVIYKQMETAIGDSFETVLGETVEGLGFNCYAIANGVTSQPGEEDRWLNSNQIGYNFMRMLGGENTVNYRDGDTSFFDSIENKILFTCSAGSYVEDYIGFNRPDQGNFEFVTDPSTITMIRGGITYITEQVTTKDGADFSVAFTAPEASEPTFWLDYYRGDGKTTERFIWTFGDYVSLDNRVSLTYKLALIEKSEIPGTYTVDTNLSVTLYPVNNDGEEGDPEIFPVPNVTYTVEGITVSGTKTWVDADNRDMIRPEKITINLLADGHEVDEAVVVADENGEWKYSFENLREFKDGKMIEYTITEDGVDGYTAVYDGYNVINMHVAGTTLTIQGIKYLDFDVAEGFEFVLVDKDQNELGKAESAADGKFGFATLVYTEEGEYHYFVKEVAGDDEDIVYDESVYTVTVTVVQDGEGLEASYVLYKDGASYQGDIVFNNETLVEIPDDPPPLDDIPETGDNTVVNGLLVVGMVVALGVMIKSKRRRFE